MTDTQQIKDISHYNGSELVCKLSHQLFQSSMHTSIPGKNFLKLCTLAEIIRTIKAHRFRSSNHYLEYLNSQLEQVKIYRYHFHYL